MYWYMNYIIYLSLMDWAVTMSWQSIKHDKSSWTTYQPAISYFGPVVSYDGPFPRFLPQKHHETHETVSILVYESLYLIPCRFIMIIMGHISNNNKHDVNSQFGMDDWFHNAVQCLEYSSVNEPKPELSCGSRLFPSNVKRISLGEKHKARAHRFQAEWCIHNWTWQTRH